MMSNEIHIGDSNFANFIDHSFNGRVGMRGLVPRDYSKNPLGSMKGSVEFDPDKMKIIPFSELPDRIREKEKNQSRLSDIRMAGNKGLMIPSLDQGQTNFCWSFSSTGATMLSRAVSGMPYVPLSATAVACMIMNYANRGGWGALSLDFIRERGVPSQAFWKQGSFDRSNDNAKTWENAALHKVTEAWIDLDVRAYDRKLSFLQVATCLLRNIPVVLDYNWWGHSVFGLDLVDVYPHLKFDNILRYGIRILNSWGDDWSENGMAVLKDNKAMPNGAVGIRSAIAA